MMGIRLDSRGYTLVELLASIVICGLLLAVILPALNLTRTPARRNACVNNLKQLGVALHTHHDAKKRIPLASSEPLGNDVGSNTDPRAGYSWIVSLLPYMEEQPLFDRIAITSSDRMVVDHKAGTAVPGMFNKPAFDPAITETDNPKAYHASSVLNQAFICPSFTGPDFATHPVYPKSGPANARRGAAIGNYVAIASAYLEPSTSRVPAAHVGGGIVGNGALPFPAKPKDVRQGLNFKAITDGMSKTVFLTETRESQYGSWYCGQSAWVVGAWLHSNTAPRPAGMSRATDGFLGWGPDELIQPGNRTALNVGGEEAGETINYINAGSFPGANDARMWGPSSEHSGNIVVHLFGDGHVVGIVTTDIDKNVYLRAISRNGGETMPPFE